MKHIFTQIPFSNKIKSRKSPTIKDNTKEKCLIISNEMAGWQLSSQQTGKKNLNLIEYINTAVKYRTKTVGKY